MRTRTRSALAGTIALLGIASAMACSQLPKIGAGGLLHPGRRTTIARMPAACQETEFAGDGVTLRGWRCGSPAPARGTIVYLHGIADNRSSASGVIERFTPRGFQVIAYDSRAHGQSGGEACTYGVFEQRDLRAVIDRLHPGPMVLIGTSLGGAVALLEAADDPRVAVVIAAETFSDLRTVATERAPFMFTRGTIERAFRLAEEQGRFTVDAAAPVAAAPRVKAAVLLIHGDADRKTSPDHSRRIFDALTTRKHFVRVPGAGHNQSLNGEVWTEIERWIDASIPPR